MQQQDEITEKITRSFFLVPTKPAPSCIQQTTCQGIFFFFTNRAPSWIQLSWNPIKRVELPCRHEQEKRPEKTKNIEYSASSVV